MKDVADRRQTKLSEAALARVEHDRTTLRAAAQELFVISGGAADGAYWAEGADNYETLLEKS